MPDRSYQKSSPQANERSPLERSTPWENPSPRPTFTRPPSTFWVAANFSGIEAARVNGGVSCRLSFRGARLSELQAEYFCGRAKVALFPFRRAFGQVNALVYSAKKKAKSQLRQTAAEGGAS